MGRQPPLHPPPPQFLYFFSTHKTSDFSFFKYLVLPVFPFFFIFFLHEKGETGWCHPHRGQPSASPWRERAKLWGLKNVKRLGPWVEDKRFWAVGTREGYK